MIDSLDKDILLDKEKLQEEKKLVETEYAVRQDFLNDLRNGVLNSAAGKRIMWDFLGLLNYQKMLFNSDPLVMAANSAIHDKALIVMKDLEEAQPGILFKMQNEFRSAQANKEK